MDKQIFNPEKIISRLQRFNYNYELIDTTLKVYLPTRCYLKIRFSNDRIRITSHLQYGFSFLPLELDFLIFGAVLFAVGWFQWANLNNGVFILLGLILIHIVICFIKLESMRSIIHQWIDKDSVS